MKNRRIAKFIKEFLWILKSAFMSFFILPPAFILLTLLYTTSFNLSEIGQIFLESNQDALKSNWIMLGAAFYFILVMFRIASSAFRPLDNIEYFQESIAQQKGSERKDYISHGVTIEGNKNYFKGLISREEANTFMDVLRRD